MLKFIIFSALLLVHVRMPDAFNPRIVNGKDAYRDQFPFMVSIQTSVLPLMPYLHICSGTVYTEFWILSSAVCVKGTKRTTRARVIIGMHFTYKKDKYSEIIKIARKIVHENFNGSSNYWANDIGLLKLKNAISNPTPLKLSTLNDAQTDEVLIMGWGKTSEGFFGNLPDVLQYGKTLILTNDDCQDIFFKTQATFPLQESQMCTHSHTDYVTGGMGDAGSPVVHYVNREPTIVGIISLILHPHNKGQIATVNTRVSHFVEWIDANLQETVKIASNDEDILAPLLVPL